MGERLLGFGHDDATRKVMACAMAENEWFTEEDILQAMEAIRLDMLDREKLTSWMSSYTPSTTPRRVAVIMAGNIPLVGFFDLMCVVMSGHHCYLKPSSKDRVLMEYVVSTLRDIESSIPIYTYDANDTYDMAIATGGDEAHRYFSEHFATTRALLRGSRHSIAVLRGDESREELEGLVKDITAYSGLGCRSVSMLFTPRGVCPAIPHCKPHNRKLDNNLRSMRALYTMQGGSFIDCGGFIMLGGEEFPRSLAQVTLREYDDISEVREWLSTNRDSVQCVVSHDAIAGSVPFGYAQRPTLTDYADSVDTMLFLTNKRAK